MLSSAGTYSLLIDELKLNHSMVRVVVDFLIFAENEAPPGIVHAALGDLHGIISNTEDLLREAFGREDSLGASRLPRRPDKRPTPKEALESFELTLDIMQVEVESLLRKPWATDEEYEKIRRRRDHVITTMGHLARYYKGVIMSRAPEIWTAEVEKRFAKFLKIKS